MDRSETNLHRPRNDPTAVPVPQPDIELEEFTVEGLGDACGWHCGPDAVFTLSERRMTVSEQAAFAEAKQKELQSFFDNCVWSYTSNVNPQRTMRARFLLKWRTGEDGQPEAKARLVLQGLETQTPLKENWKPRRPQQPGWRGRCFCPLPLFLAGRCTPLTWPPHFCKETARKGSIREIACRRRENDRSRIHEARQADVRTDRRTTSVVSRSQ